MTEQQKRRRVLNVCLGRHAPKGNRKTQLSMKADTGLGDHLQRWKMGGGGTQQSLPGYSWEEEDAVGHGVMNYRSKILERPKQESPKASM